VILPFLSFLSISRQKLGIIYKISESVAFLDMILRWFFIEQTFTIDSEDEMEDY
jgi:hypothetical protein